MGNEKESPILVHKEDLENEFKDGKFGLMTWKTKAAFSEFKTYPHSDFAVLHKGIEGIDDDDFLGEDLDNSKISSLDNGKMNQIIKGFINKDDTFMTCLKTNEPEERRKYCAINFDEKEKNSDYIQCKVLFFL